MTATTRKQHFSDGIRDAKVALRLAVLPEGPVRVLGAGDHDLWDAVRRVRDDVTVLHIEQHPRHPGDLPGDNRKWLASLDVAAFDLIDLDAWGVPADQMRLLSRRSYPGVICWTSITVGMASLPDTLYRAVGVDPAWRGLCGPITLSRLLAARFADAWLDALAAWGWTSTVYTEPARNHLYGAVGHHQWNVDAYHEHLSSIRQPSPERTP